MNRKESSYFNLKYGSLLSLYLAQSIPMSFFSTVLPVILRENGFSLTSIGLLQLVKIPWILKFLWAPHVDAHSQNLRDYKKWIIRSEIFYAIIIFSIAFLNLQTHFGLIIIFLVVAFTASATQDIATDAFAYYILLKKERSLGSSVQTAGNFLGALIGSGVLLIIYDYMGWKILILALGIFVLLALIPLKKYQPEKQKISIKEHVQLIDLILFFKQPKIFYRILILLTFYWSIIGILSMLKPWMVDMNYSIQQIGIFSGLYGPLSGFFMALITGRIIKKIGLSKSLKLILILATINTLYFYLIKTYFHTYIFLQIGILLVWGIYSMMTVFIYTFIMDRIRKGKAGTDFTLQIVLAHIGSLIMAVSSGKIAHSLGYGRLFILEFCLAIISLILIPYLYKKTLKYEI